MPPAFQREILLPRKFLGSESKILAINEKHPTTMTCVTQKTYRVNGGYRIRFLSFSFHLLPLQRTVARVTSPSFSASYLQGFSR